MGRLYSYVAGCLALLCVPAWSAEFPPKQLFAVGIYVTDMGRSVAFYRDVLKLKEMSEATRNGRRQAYFSDGNAAILILISADHKIVPGQAASTVQRIEFTVPDIQSAVAGIKKAGFPVVQAPHRMSAFPEIIAYTKDPDGMPIALRQDLR